MTEYQVDWRTREPPLTAVAVMAHGDAAALLARRLLTCIDDADFSVHLGDNQLVVQGNLELLGWIDGATWLGRESGLLCPTTLMPTLASDLVISAAQRLAGRQGTVVATPDEVFVLPVAIGSVDPHQVANFAERVEVAP